MPQIKLEQNALASFRTRADEILRRVQTAVGNVIVPLVGSRSVRSADLVESLGLDTRLAWKLTKVMDLPDPIESARYVPGPRGVKLFLQAAARRKAPEPALQEAHKAFTSLQRLIDTEAGDRRSFDMMIAGYTDNAAAGQVDAGLEHRRGAFEHNGFIWGVQARAQLRTSIVGPAKDGVHIDAAVLSGFIDLRRIRPQTPWRISRFFTVDDAGHIAGTFDREPIDPAAAESANGLPLLREFCSKPLPEVYRTTGPQGVVDYRLAGNEVGNSTSITCITGEIIRQAEPLYPDESHKELCVHTALRTPCEAVIVDVMVDRTIFKSSTPRAELVSDLFNDGLARQYSELDRLPFLGQVEALGACEPVAPVREMDTYQAMIAASFQRLGWDARNFDLYRIYLRYPPIAAAVMIWLPLPERPA